MIKCSICRLYATSVDGTFSEMNDDDNDEDKINDKINDNNDKCQIDNQLINNNNDKQQSDN